VSTTVYLPTLVARSLDPAELCKNPSYISSLTRGISPEVDDKVVVRPSPAAADMPFLLSSSQVRICHLSGSYRIESTQAKQEVGPSSVRSRLVPRSHRMSSSALDSIDEVRASTFSTETQKRLDTVLNGFRASSNCESATSLVTDLVGDLKFQLLAFEKREGIPPHQAAYRALGRP